MKVEVDWDLCESNGVCMGSAPEVFELRDDDNLYLLKEDVGPEDEDAVRSAVSGCPRQAIRLTA